MSKYITGFDYTDEILIVLATTVSGISVFSHLKIKKHTSLLYFFFCLSTAVIRKLLYEIKKRKKDHNKVLYLGKNKLDCIEMLISQAIIDLQISHEEFKMNVDYENQKENMIKGKLNGNIQI